VEVITFFTSASSPATFATKQYSGANDTTTCGFVAVEFVVGVFLQRR